jgi:hypothetical protein
MTVAERPVIDTLPSGPIECFGHFSYYEMTECRCWTQYLSIAFEIFLESQFEGSANQKPLTLPGEQKINKLQRISITHFRMFTNPGKKLSNRSQSRFKSVKNLKGVSLHYNGARRAPLLSTPHT